MNSTTATDRADGSADSQIERYSGTVLAVLVSVVYGWVAFGPVIGIWLVAHPTWLPGFTSAGLGLAVPVAFRSWRSHQRAINALTFSAVALVLTTGVNWLLFDPVPLVRGRKIVVLEVALAVVGAGALALAVTWYYSAMRSAQA
ncbi:hypothetical protein [Halapricum desulfuricans]|uniref:hypothetical protein n=1 Tax=Halapricum desulfuricans TaxID=2841257 RepID=UPI001E612B8D|nr:hypothetical protein [Halapricum desulfuricans]